MCGYE